MTQAKSDLESDSDSEGKTQNGKDFKNIYCANLCHRHSANNANFAIDFIIDYDQLTD